ncbi:MAG: hypothetical protein H7841_02730 [Magnetospirillum sp. WYHS-4]
MPVDFSKILDKLNELEETFERELEEGRRRFHYQVVAKKVRFEQQRIDLHRRLRKGPGRFLAESGVLALLASPLVYALFLPLALLDLLVLMFVHLGFPVYGIAKVRRADYVVFDRHQLAYLNLIEKLNCVYCGYANGVIAYAREVASRSEAHWCPIKHARRTRDPHRRYWRFAEFGDGEAYRRISGNDPVRPD